MEVVDSRFFTRTCSIKLFGIYTKFYKKSKKINFGNCAVQDITKNIQTQESFRKIPSLLCHKNFTEKQCIKK